MLSRIKTGPKIALLVLVVALAMWQRTAILSHLPSTFSKALTLGRVSMPSIADAAIPNVTPIAYPSSSDCSVPSTLFRGGLWEWNAQNGLPLANGGKSTKCGSLMQKYGVNLSLERQDDTGKMAEGLVACAKELKDGAKQCSSGYNFVVIMGGGSAQFAALANAQLAKLGPEWKLKTIGALGRSNGEDGYWAPSSVKSNPHSISSTVMADSSGQELPVHGLLITGVIRDDDWNIAQKWAGDNNIPNNPDEKTFDPDAINWINSPDYLTAANDFVAAKCEDRTLVKQGHATGEKVHVCANGTVTWTPGDVIAATKRGGVVRIASSRDYYMPAIVIGPGKFFSDNTDETVGLLTAALAAGDQIRAFPDDRAGRTSALHKACAIAAEIYGDQGDNGFSNGDYWYKYAKGVTQNDAHGVPVPLGGSAVYGLEDNLALFGIKDGANDDYRSIYSTFQRIDLLQYPAIFKSTPIPPVNEVENKSYLAQVKDKLSDTGTSIAQATTVDYGAQANGSTLGDANYHINFATGSADPLPDGVSVLQQLKDSLAITSAAIEVSGHTDNTGNPALNNDLSRRRAQTVENFLHSAAPSKFPLNRFRVQGYGSSKPIADNSTSDGKAQNRRVEIVLRSK